MLCAMVIAFFGPGAYGHGAVTQPIPREWSEKPWCPWCVGENQPLYNPPQTVNRSVTPSSPCMGTSREDGPFPSERFGRYKSWVGSASPYIAGQTFSATIVLDADHNGEAQWSYCPHSLAETEQCFREHTLTDWINVAAHWNQTDPGEHFHSGEHFPQTVHLPSDMPAGPATLRWLWVCKNTNELFLSCIDVDVVSNDNGAPETTSTTTQAEFEPAPEPEFEPVTPTPTALPTPTPTSASTPAPTPVGNVYCRNRACGCPPFTGGADWCDDISSGGWGEWCNAKQNQCEDSCGGLWCPPLV